MIRRPPRSTQSRSSAASDVYKRQGLQAIGGNLYVETPVAGARTEDIPGQNGMGSLAPVSYTHLRAHETVLDLVCRLLLEKKKRKHTSQNDERDRLYNQQI